MVNIKQWWGENKDKDVVDLAEAKVSEAAYGLVGRKRDITNVAADQEKLRQIRARAAELASKTGSTVSNVAVKTSQNLFDISNAKRAQDEYQASGYGRRPALNQAEERLYERGTYLNRQNSPESRKHQADLINKQYKDLKEKQKLMKQQAFINKQSGQYGKYSQLQAVRSSDRALLESETRKIQLKQLKEANKIAKQQVQLQKYQQQPQQYQERPQQEHNFNAGLNLPMIGWGNSEQSARQDNFNSGLSMPNSSMNLPMIGWGNLGGLGGGFGQERPIRAGKKKQKRNWMVF